MRNVSFQVYSYNELSESAKETARSSVAATTHFIDTEWALTSMTRLADFFNGSIVDSEVDFGGGTHSAMSFIMPELTREEIAEKLKELGDYNPETLQSTGENRLSGDGDYEDEDMFDAAAVQGFRIAFNKGEADIGELMEAAFRFWLEHCQTLEKSLGEDEAFAQYAEECGMEFYEDGRKYKQKRF